ncbi:hypothetical protein N0V88_007344 [Collariella sp. IMI 366227]|nr:hypothetical protein N0V88_007344 [Collariella sp. IMI 366227]
MAPPFTGIKPEKFKRVKAKAVSQLIYRNDKNCDTETMALEIAWLNDCYRGQGVYFALLGAPGLDLEAFPAPQVKKTFLFQQHEEIWSVACVERWPEQVIMQSTGRSSPSPSRMITSRHGSTATTR